MRFSDMRLLIIVLAAALVSAMGGAQARDKDAALVMDASTGKILYGRNANEPRYPASLTKMMTLYILFEAIEKGETELYARMNVSPEAASQKPTRLGLRPGDILTVEDAIKALVIRSANDASVAIAEHLSGSEDRFAVRMTQKARALGMNNTTFQNASGLPNLQQQSTALDLAVLSRRLQTDFPRFYPYFSQRNFTWNGRFYRGHNRLLGNFDGADGLKTGYTRLSGYNLATSASRRGTRLIGVVLGGSSGYSRDVQMADMLETQFGKLGLGRPASIIVAMSPLVPDEDEMDGAGSRQIVIETAIESRPDELAVRPASVNPNAPHLNPIVPRAPSAPSAPAGDGTAALQPAAASMMGGGVIMGPIVPDAAPQRRGRRSPVSDARPLAKPDVVAALPPARGTMAPVRDGDAIAGLINANRPAAANAFDPKPRTKARAERPRETARRSEPKAKSVRAAKSRNERPAKIVARDRTEPKAKATRVRAEPKVAAPKGSPKKDAKANGKPAKSEARNSAKPDRKSKQSQAKGTVRRVASR
jgi:D-alanyl-D-alanine carboxypeptidase